MTLYQPDEGPVLAAGPTSVRFLVGSDETDGTMSIEELRIGPNFGGPPNHVHGRTTHSWFVLSGTATFTIDGVVHRLGPGGFAHVPAGQPHGFANDTAEEVRFLQVSAPGGFERYLRDLTEAFPKGSAVDHEKVIEIMRRHDTRPV